MEFSIARLGVRALAPLSETTHARLESFDYVLSWNVVFHGTMGDVGRRLAVGYPPEHSFCSDGFSLGGRFDHRRADPRDGIDHEADQGAGASRIRTLGPTPGSARQQEWHL
jgi:hypothetical protein